MKTTKIVHEMQMWELMKNAVGEMSFDELLKWMCTIHKTPLYDDEEAARSWLAQTIELETILGQ